MMYGYGTFGWIGMILNLVITVGLVIGIVFLVVWLVRRSSATNVNQPSTQPTAREILQTRYARGEIGRDEYLQMLTDLT
jgi:putative membrane protein